MNPNSKQKRIAFGYQRLANNRIAIHEGQAATLQLIYRMYAEGKVLGKCAAAENLCCKFLYRQSGSKQGREYKILDIAAPRTDYQIRHILCKKTVAHYRQPSSCNYSRIGDLFIIRYYEKIDNTLMI